MEVTVKYPLAQEVPFTLLVDPFTGGGLVFDFSPMSAELDTRSTEGTPVPQKDLLEKLSAALENQPLKWKIILRWIPSISETRFRMTFEMGSALKEVLGEEACLQARIFLGDFRFNTAELPVATAAWAPAVNLLLFVESSRNAEMEGWLHQNGIPSRGKMDLLLVQKSLDNPYSGDQKSSCVALLCERMLKEEMVADAIIIPSNGAEVKCHRVFLAAHSDVFRTMFATDMQEAQTRIVEIPDMSEEGVRALLAFLYHWDESQARENGSVTLELLKAAHKYNIRSLENAMRKLLLGKPETWDEVDVAMKLFLFVWNLDPEWESLKKKAVLVLKMNSGILKNSPTFQQLFRDNPEAAMDFYQYSVSV